MSEDQLRLFAEERRNASMSQVEEHADEFWKDAAYRFLVEYLQTHETMFVDDLWAAGLPHTREDRALGPLFMLAARRRLMEKTGRFRQSVRSNLTEKPVWRSLIYERED